MVGQEQRSERRSEGRPAYSAASRVHLRHHRALITATQLTGTQDTDIRAMRSGAMGTQAIRDTPPTPVLRAMDTQATRDTLPTPVLPMDTRAARHTLPIPVLVMEIRWLVIPAIALWRAGRLEPSTVSSLLAESWPKIRPRPSTPLVRGKGKRLRKIALAAEKGRHSTAAVARGLEPLSASCVRHRFIHLGGKPEQE